jgi:hypothetical protein
MEIYDAADQSLNATIPKADFVDGLKAIRSGRGAVKSTRQLAIDYSYSSGSRMVKLLVLTNLEKGEAEEQFIFVISNHEPHLRSYVFQ